MQLLKILQQLSIRIKQYEKLFRYFKIYRCSYNLFKETSHIALLHTNVHIFFNTSIRNAVRFTISAYSYIEDTLGKLLYYKGKYYENNQLTVR